MSPNDVTLKLQQMYRGSIALLKESGADLYYTCCTPLGKRIPIRVNIKSKKVFEGNEFKYYLI